MLGEAWHVNYMILNQVDKNRDNFQISDNDGYI